jgi:carbamate kinase
MVAITVVTDHISDGDFLSSMQLAEAMGDMKCLRSMFEGYRRLAASPDPAVQAEYARLRTALDAGQAIEAKHGRGCLLKLDHPTVVSFVKKGVIDPDDRANAVRYQTWISDRDAACA